VTSREKLDSTWAILEGQITVVIDAKSPENNRRGRRPLRLGQAESRDFFSRPLAPATWAALPAPRKLWP